MNNQILSELQKRYGESFYVFDEERFISNLDEVESAFKNQYANFGIAYSFKTNYIPRICKLAMDQGAFAEVVSEMEYEHALRVGYKPEKIIYNGPVKSREILFRAFENNSIVHFDSDNEIDVLEEYLSASPRESIRCALRINFSMEGEKTSRFGFNSEDDSAGKAYERLFGLKGCKPIGVHCHFQTATKTLESFAERTQKTIAFAKKVFAEHPCEYIDVGGGFFGKMPPELLRQFSAKVPSFEEYSRVIGATMIKDFPDQDVKLIIEPGTMVVADTMKFYCTVNNVKFIGDKAFVVTNGSLHNIKPTGRSRILPGMKVIQMHKGNSYQVKNGDITGYTCIDDDVLSWDFNGEIAPGDYLEFCNVGAYSPMYKPPFIKGQPPILSKKDEQFLLIKRGEVIDDIFATYIY